MKADQSYRHAATYILLAALIMSLAISYRHDRARQQGELELAREAYSQHTHELQIIHSRLEGLDAAMDEILRALVPNGAFCAITIHC